MTTSRRDLRPAGGVWQGVNPRTGSVASAICVTRPAWDQAIVFISIDGASLKGDHGDPAVEGDPYTEEGGEGRWFRIGPNPSGEIRVTCRGDWEGGMDRGSVMLAV